ncbi:hypothetical protein ACLX1H_000413 [Fusarium chlamydosporum]
MSTYTTGPTFHIEATCDSTKAPRKNYTWRVNQDMSDLFATLDELALDLVPFNYKDPPAKRYHYNRKPLPPLPALPSSTCIDSTKSDISSTSSHFILFAPEQEYEKQFRAYDESLRTKDVIRDTVYDKVQRWLSQIPEQPEIAATYIKKAVDAELSKKKALHSRKTPAMKHKRHQKSEPVISSPRMSDDTTIAATEESRTQHGGSGSAKSCCADPTGDRVGILDGYHSAMLHIHMLSKDSNAKFCPTMRRNYPRGLEDEARLGIGVAFVAAEI